VNVSGSIRRYRERKMTIGLVQDLLDRGVAGQAGFVWARKNSATADFGVLPEATESTSSA